MKNYVLQQNALALKRLYLQYQLYQDSNEHLLRNAGLSKGMKVLEVGCGPGHITPFLAEQVGRNGTVMSIDISEYYIHCARENNKTLKNCQFAVMDIHNIDELNDRYDFILARLVLHHLNDTEQVFSKLASLLKQNGILVCEDPPAMEGVFAYPPSKALDKMTGLVIKVFKDNNVDYTVAYKLIDYFKKYGLEITVQQVYQPLLLTAEQRQLHQMGLEDISDTLIDSKLITKKALDNLKKALDLELAKCNTISLYRNFQVAGYKRKE